ncbi:MAG: integral membrane protein [Candidatus Azotimanducaceae bacterium]|jgi:integral membrane protein
MPVKYILGEPILIRVIGPAHCSLFIVYLVQLALTAMRNPLPWWALPAGAVGAVIPFGPFLFEYLIAKWSEKTATP